MTNAAESLAGRRIIVTGGASGMGAGLVRALPSLGASVVSLDSAADEGSAVAAEAGTGFFACDVSNPAGVTAAVSNAVEHLGGLDVLVHAAGIAPGAPAGELPIEQWNLAMAVNATGTFLMNQAVLPALIEAGGGRIINFASAAGITGYPGKAAYAASKGAVVAWTRTVALEWATHGITVNAIAPAIWTPMYDRTRASMTPEQLAAHDVSMTKTVPLGGRLGDIDRDLVPVVAFLAGPGSGFMTGQIYSVDGGKLMLR